MKKAFLILLVMLPIIGSAQNEDVNAKRTEQAKRIAEQMRADKNQRNKMNEEDKTDGFDTKGHTGGKTENVFGQSNEFVYINDSAFFLKIVKKNGWFVGIGEPISEVKAGYHNCYYKFSRKNNAGQWTLMETFDGYGNPTTNHNMGTYLVNPNDDDDTSANATWKSKLQSVCKWEFIGDNNGESVVQERGLDKDGNIVFIYSPVKVGENEYVGSYTDAWGMPIFQRTDSTGNDIGCANFVHVFRDERGFEVLYSYTDRHGNNQKNAAGAYMTRMEYDDNGNMTTNASLNIIGEMMIDDYGNCGYHNEYDSNNNEIRSWYFDNYGRPMQMPKLKSGSMKVWGYKYEYDEHGRNTEVFIVDSMGNPDTNEFGVHAFKKEYNRHGQQTRSACYDLSGKLIAQDTSGIAVAISEYDSLGHHTKTIFLDGLGNLFNNPYSDYCKIEKEWKDNIEIHEVEYKVDSNGIVNKSFEYIRDSFGNGKRVWYQNDLCKIDSVDGKERIVYSAYFDLKGNPKDHDNYHKQLTSYDDKIGLKKEQWFDKDGNAALNEDNEYSMRTYQMDSSTHIQTNQDYYYGFIEHAYQTQYSDDFQEIESQWDITQYGEHARVGWWNNIHYTCGVKRNMYGKIEKMIGKNEFDEPSYLKFLGDGNVGYIMCVGDKENRYFDENGQEILDMDGFKSMTPEVYCIEVTDTSKAFPLGIRNNDIIISYGDWTISENLKTNLDYFYLETILKVKKTKPIIVMRHNIQKGTSELIRINELPEGRPSDMGFYAHRIFYTQKEKNRLLKTCVSNSLALHDNDNIIGDNYLMMVVPVKGGLLSSRCYHLSMYDVKDAGIVLLGNEFYSINRDKWSVLDNISEWDEKNMMHPQFVGAKELYYTQDIKTLRSISKTSKGNGGLTFVPIAVDTDTYFKIRQLYLAFGDDSKSVFGKQSLHIKEAIVPSKISEKKLKGNWAITEVEGDSKMTLNLSMMDNNELKYYIAGVLIQEGIMIEFRLDVSSAKWAVNGGCFLFDDSEAERTVTINNFFIDGMDDMDEETKNLYWLLLKIYLESSSDDISASEFLGSNHMLITSMDRGKLTLYGEDEKILIKGKR